MALERSARRSTSARRAGVASVQPESSREGQERRAEVERQSRWRTGALLARRKKSLALGLLLILVNRAAGLVLPLSTQAVVDDVIARRQLELLVGIIATVLAATALQGASSLLLTHVLAKAGQRLVMDLRRELQTNTLHLPIAFFDRSRIGALAARIMQDAEAVRSIVDTGLVEMGGSLLTAVIAFVVLAHISPSMTFVVVLELAALGVFFRLLFPGIQRRLRIHRRLLGEVSARLIETLGGIRVVKSYRAEPRETAVFGEAVGRVLENMLQSLTASGVLAAVVPVFIGVIGATVLYLGAGHMLSGDLSLGSFFMYVVLLGYLVSPILQVVTIGRQLGDGIAGLERAFDILKERREDEDPQRTIAVQQIAGNVVFDRVSFAYERGDPVLADVSFRASPGTVTAIVGPSGSGKSTALGLIAAFNAATSGTVRVDGIDLSCVRLDSYRSRIGIVLQDTFLFDGSLRDNVALGRPDACDEEIRDACALAGVAEFAARLDCGLDTVVGERGVRLSGGQRQRVAIARAMLVDPAILLLDEATSSLDSESEHLIQSALRSLMRGRTTFVITHRLSTIRAADQILVMERGRVIERGRHEALYVQRGRYFEMYTRQQGRSVESSGAQVAEAD
jgi:subfamily B ATP-binding cassette protein MsbA